MTQFCIANQKNISLSSSVVTRQVRHHGYFTFSFFVERKSGKSKDVCASEYPPTEIRLSILAYDASKPALASVARSFARHAVNDVQAWEAKTRDSTNFIEVVDCALRG